MRERLIQLYHITSLVFLGCNLCNVSLILTSVFIRRKHRYNGLVLLVQLSCLHTNIVDFEVFSLHHV
jgi:hypothetical protein